MTDINKLEKQLNRAASNRASVESEITKTEARLKELRGDLAKAKRVEFDAKQALTFAQFSAEGIGLDDLRAFVASRKFSEAHHVQE